MGKNKEIDILGIISKILTEKKLLVRFVVISAILGVIVALSKPKSYTAEVVLAPEISSGGIGLSESLSDMASTFGVDLGSKSSYDAIYPELYPDVFASTDFILSLFDVPVRLKDSKVTKTYYAHITQDAKIPFWDYPKMWIIQFFKSKTKKGKGNKDNYVMAKDDYEICNAVRGAISCQVDKKTSVITINITDEDPLVAAIMADTLQRRLQEYITSYRTQKARNDYEYYKKLFVESKSQYLQAQQLYASYSDANQNIVLQSYKSKQDELENEMQLKYNLYTQVSTQMQNARAKVQERTPAFEVLERPTMPYKATSTPKMMIVMLFIMLGCFADGLWICFIRDYRKHKLMKNTENDI